ncbi:MAG: hypothetical protein K6L81_17080 [Agarilytica sp.]
MFNRYFLGSWGTYFFLLLLSFSLKLYEIFPGTGIIGYSVVIGFLLAALNEAIKKWHYLVVGASLVLFGAIASFDIVLSKQELAELWVLYGWFPLTMQHVDGYMQVIIILLNIFTGSLAANCLFHGLNKRNFSD